MPQMNEGADRVEVPYVWPPTLITLPRPPKLVYLDLNQWIALAKASAGHRDGARYQEALDLCTAAVDDGRAVFPISDSIYSEVSKIGPHRQRRDLREVIERVCGYRVVASRSVISAHEIEALLDDLIGPNPHPINTMDYLDWGVARAFGLVGGFRIRDASGGDVTTEVRSRHPDGPEAFDRVLAQAELELNRKTLEGPTPDEEPELRADGWEPTAAQQISERRANQEIEQVARFNEDPSWRRGRVRDVVAAREVLVEINDALYRGFAERGASLDSVFSDVGQTRRAFDSMPSFDVAVTLKTSYHRDPNHRWTTNDVHDIDAMGSTLPYCDIVVTDKAMASHIHRTALSDRLQTVALARLSELDQHL
jgi:hypothetical protein